MKRILLLFSLAIFSSVIPISNAFGTPVIYFNQPDYLLDSLPIVITINDSSNPNFTDFSSGVQKISAVLESGAEKKMITLTETGITSGIFTTSIGLSHQDYAFNVGSIVSISFIQDDHAYSDENGTAYADVSIYTKESTTFLTKEKISKLVLTGSKSELGLFTGTLVLVNNSTSGNQIKVEPGDIIVIQNDYGHRFYGLVLPNPNNNFDIIKISNSMETDFYLDTLRASYHEVSATADVLNDLCSVDDEGIADCGGGGGGGLVHRPGLVLDFVGALVAGGSSQSNEPPTLGLGQNQKRIVNDGFSFNDNPIDVLQYYTPYPMITTPVGQNNTIKLKIYEDKGPDNIAHVGLSYGLGKGEIFNEGRATIEYDRTFDGKETVTLFDPKHVLGSVNVTTSDVRCGENSNAVCREFAFHHIFRAPLEYNMVATNIWDFELNGWQNYFNHGIQIVGDSMNPPEEYSGIYKGHIYHLTETGKNAAIDDQGNKWTFDKTWNRDYIKPAIVDNDILNQEKMGAIEKLGFKYSDGQAIFGVDRVDHRFADVKNQQKIEAQTIIDDLCPGCQKRSFEKIDHIFSYSLPDRHSKLEANENLMKIEDKKARQFLQTFFEQIYHKSPN